MSRRECDGLKQVIGQNDASARFAIGQLQSALDAARAENERLRVAFESAGKQANDGKVRADPTPCLDCPRLRNEIGELKLQIAELTRQLNSELAKRS